jgi:hypothetical protein
MPKHHQTAQPSLADYISLRTDRLRLQREADQIEEREKLILEYLISQSVANDLAPIVDGTHTLVVTKKVEPQPNDWPALLAHIRSTGEVDLLEKRLMKSAASARWADGQSVPGVTETTKYVTKVQDNG